MAGGRAAGEVTVSAPSTMVRENVWLAKRRAESVTLTVKLQEPGVVAVPETTPLEARESSGGKEPEVTAHV
jgi:hypothetical protein